MTDTAIPSATMNDAVASAALLLAEQLGLGDEARGHDEWPIDAGDEVLVAPFSGDADGMLALAVNDDVADRLQANPALLERAFGAAIDSIARTAGATLVPGAVVRGTIPAPVATAMVLDGGALTALTALVVAEPAPAPATPPAHPVYEPAALDAPSSTPAPSPAAVAALSVLHDVELVVTAELGRTTMPVRDVLNLNPGMVVEIDRMAGSPIDLLVNGRRIATGEVVVIDEEFGIRITEIIATSDPR